MNQCPCGMLVMQAELIPLCHSTRPKWEASEWLFKTSFLSFSLTYLQVPGNPTQKFKPLTNSRFFIVRDTLIPILRWFHSIELDTQCQWKMTIWPGQHQVKIHQEELWSLVRVSNVLRNICTVFHSGHTILPNTPTSEYLSRGTKVRMLKKEYLHTCDHRHISP